MSINVFSDKLKYLTRIPAKKDAVIYVHKLCTNRYTCNVYHLMEAKKVGLCQRQSVSNWYNSTLFLKEEMVATRPILRMCDIAAV